MSDPRPSTVCRWLLEGVGASEGARSRRKRNTTPDALGLGIKRDLLQRAVTDDPDSGSFERWLMDRVLEAGDASGGVRAVALEIFYEWQAVLALPEFRAWLDAGAPVMDRSSPLC